MMDSRAWKWILERAKHAALTGGVLEEFQLLDDTELTSTELVKQIDALIKILPSSSYRRDGLQIGILPPPERLFSKGGK